MNSDRNFFASVLLDEESIDQTYQQSFATEGGRKVHDLIEPRLRRLIRDGRYDPDSAVVVSIGCADGSDMAYLLKNKLASRAIGVEFSSAGVGRAREIAMAFGLASAPRMEIIQGDAMQALPELKEKLKVLHALAGVNTVILVLLGTLHELPARSPHYSFNALVDGVCGLMPNAIVGISEPSGLSGWETHDERVIASFGTTPQNVVLAHASLAANAVLGCKIDPLLAMPSCLRPFAPSVAHGRQAVELDVQHLGELLQKSRNGSASRLRYELGERVSWLCPTAVKGVLQSVHGFSETEILLRTSSGIHEAWRHSLVRVLRQSGHPLHVPFTHFTLTSHRIEVS